MKVVLDKIDKDHDGKITVEELEAVGLDGLPNFDSLGAEGHHYDVESGTSHQFLHTCSLYSTISVIQSSSFITKNNSTPPPKPKLTNLIIILKISSISRTTNT